MADYPTQFLLPNLALAFYLVDAFGPVKYTFSETLLNHSFPKKMLLI
jgi:hypothetical protein